MRRRLCYQAGLFYFALATTLCTLGLIGLGGLVTSHGVGMAVPDWPTTYGYNMFLFPISQWTGGIFYEHTHRLFASWVGLLTTVLAVWLWLREERRWLRWLGVLAFVLVVFQGVLGGLRVVMFKDEIGIFHATLAQLFLVLLTGMTLALSRWWWSRAWSSGAQQTTPWMRRLVILGTVLIMAQLILGATMRHEHAGLAVPDFPMAYGGWWPPMDADSLQAINQARLDVRDYNPITATHIAVHMSHRIMALLIAMVVGAVLVLANRRPRGSPTLTRGVRIWAGLIGLQVILGAATVWSNKAADVATLHVLLGAMSLAWGSLLVILSVKFSVAENSPLRHSGLPLSESPVRSAGPAVTAG